MTSEHLMDYTTPPPHPRVLEVSLLLARFYSVMPELGSKMAQLTDEEFAWLSRNERRFAEAEPDSTAAWSLDLLDFIRTFPLGRGAADRRLAERIMAENAEQVRTFTGRPPETKGEA